MQEKPQHLYLTSSFRGDGVAEMVMNSIEKLLQKPATKIKLLYMILPEKLKPKLRATNSKFGRGNR